MRHISGRSFSPAVVAVIVILILLFSCVGVIALARQYLLFDKQVELLATAVANLFGTIVGATLAFWFALRQLTIQSKEVHKKALVDTTFELHREFNSSEMSEARNRADKIFKQYPTPVTLDALEENFPEVEARPIYLVIRFYQRLWLAIKNKRVDTKLIPELFGEIFYWWFVNYLEPQVMPVGWQICSDIQDLKNWFDENSDQIMYRVWLDRALLEKQKRVANVSAAGEQSIK
ncbi:MAG: hypothetical protein HC936_18155 [Leptolyngbyaceae cyanobacterium SU_3_3]|nr:hypothetical protein [Leptolyngbyaceae cyanobacterium SU_3_3]